jgi:hypothetical protein
VRITEVKVVAQVKVHGDMQFALAGSVTPDEISALSQADFIAFLSKRRLARVTQNQIVSGTTLVALNELAMQVEAGKSYRFEYVVRFRSSSTTNGIGFTFQGDGADGIASVDTVVSADGTASLFSGLVTAANDVVISTGVPNASNPSIVKINGCFTATQDTTVNVFVRSEVSNGNVTILPPSFVEMEELP